MNFNPGFNIQPTTQPMGFQYGPGVFGPKVESRTLDSIRKSLRDPHCSGPDPVYSIAMDVGKNEHRPILLQHHLLYGAVTYAAGRLGDEPVRSQGHIHKVSSLSKWSTPEVYEIWSGKAIIYMQETALDNPGRCFAVTALPGDVVIVPPNWAHATISADPLQPLTFGAWCDRDYGFEYDDVRARKGLAWFPLLDNKNAIYWEANPYYEKIPIIEKLPRKYREFGLQEGCSIYKQFEIDNARFQFVSKPDKYAKLWSNFEP